jgi:hypothetical protein
MRLDLHVHSVYSHDGAVAPGDIVIQARKYGLHGVAITDHNTPEGARQGLLAASGMKDFIVVRGIEVSAREGHVLVYGTDEPSPKGRRVAEVVRWAADNGGIAVAAHPYRRWTGIGEKVVRKSTFTAVEGLNSNSDKNDNARARRLAESLGKPCIGGSDAHTMGMIGAGLTVFKHPVETESDVIEAIAKGACYPEGMSATPLMSIRNAMGNFTGWLGRGMRRV